MGYTSTEIADMRRKGRRGRGAKIRWTTFVIIVLALYIVVSIYNGVQQNEAIKIVNAYSQATMKYDVFVDNGIVGHSWFYITHPEINFNELSRDKDTRISYALFGGPGILDLDDFELPKESIAESYVQQDSKKDFAAQVLELVNDERASVGIAPLQAGNAALQQAADIRANELRDLFSHTRPNGTDCFTVFGETGVTGYMTCAENIASGAGSPSRVMDLWMDSPGHRANILDPNQKYLCVGYIKMNWVQLFIG